MSVLDSSLLVSDVATSSGKGETVKWTRSSVSLNSKTDRPTDRVSECFKCSLNERTDDRTTST